MKKYPGVKFKIGKNGKVKCVVINLKKHSHLLEDFFDIIEMKRINKQTKPRDYITLEESKRVSEKKRCIKL